MVRFHSDSLTFIPEEVDYGFVIVLFIFIRSKLIETSWNWDEPAQAKLGLLAETESMLTVEKTFSCHQLYFADHQTSMFFLFSSWEVNHFDLTCPQFFVHSPTPRFVGDFPSFQNNTYLTYLQKLLSLCTLPQPTVRGAKNLLEYNRIY